MTGLPTENGHDPTRLPDAYFAAPAARFGPSALRAAWWAWMAQRTIHKRLATDGIQSAVPAAPHLPPGATRAVQSVLRRVGATPLERSLVLQAWLVACGERYDVIVGVDADESVPTHGWLPFETGEESRFPQTTRIPARTR